MELKEYQRLHSKKTRLKRISENRCADCGKHLQAGEHNRCEHCRIKHNLGTKKAFDLLAKKGLCRICQKPVVNSSNKYQCKECNSKNRIRRTTLVQNTKKRCIQLLGGKCNVCGLKTDFISVYDFHHKNPEEKENGIRYLLGCTWEKIEKELIKCILVCSNCHRIIHFEKEI